MIKHIKPLPISEEMLGAYLEGNLSSEDVRNVENMLSDDDDLNSLMNEIMNCDINETVSIEQDLLNWNEGFELPEIKWEDSDLEGFDSLSLNNGLYGEMDSFFENGNDDLTFPNVEQEMYGDMGLDDLKYSENLNMEYNWNGDFNENDTQWDNWDE